MTAEHNYLGGVAPPISSTGWLDLFLARWIGIGRSSIHAIDSTRLHPAHARYAQETRGARRGGAGGVLVGDARSFVGVEAPKHTDPKHTVRREVRVLIMVAMAVCFTLLVAPCWSLRAHVLRGSTSTALRSRPLSLSANVNGAMLAELSKDLAAVKALRPGLVDASPEVQRRLWKAAGLDPRYKVSGMISGEPSFTKLMAHETWQKYTGVPPATRWARSFMTWRFSTIWSAVWPLCLFAAIWAYAIASLPVLLIPRTSPVPLTLMGSAIGFAARLPTPTICIHT